MRTFITLIGLLFLSCMAIAQTATPSEQTPLMWGVEIQKVSDAEYKLIYKASLLDGWHSYSVYTEDNGPVPTSITYEDESTFEKVGKLEETTSAPENRKEGLDPLFDVNVIKYKHDFTIVQSIKTKDASKPIKGYITAMVCDAESCRPPADVEFEFDLNAVSAKLASAVPPAAGGDNAAPTIDIIRPKIAETLKSASEASACGVESDATGTADKDLLWIFVAGFLGGLFALLTPCVFPMLPLTVSYFTKRSKTRTEGVRNGLIYSVSIIVIYVGLGLLITRTLGADALNILSTHWLPNVIFFVLFIVFAISFFGYYEITLPSSWSNKTDAAADKGGLLGIFFMAFTLALVSFSCTGPIIGTLLVEAADGGVQGPMAGMFGFSLALALPFGLFSMFPSWLQSLPRSGGWMTTMKVVLGFIEIGLAFKFLSKADLTEHWGVLKYETFLVAVIVCSLGLAAYLFGFIKFPHDDEGQPISILRKIFAAFWIGFAAYVGTGFTIHTHEKYQTKTYVTPFLLSGIAPPACYSYACPCECPAGINQCFKDYYEGLAEAKRTNKPIMIDFTGHGCENCRKMEDKIWIKDRINHYINDEYILISLYVDDRKALDSVRTTADGRKLRTVGSLWAEFELANFNQQSQPLYVLVSPNEEVLHAPIGATFDEEKYANFLQCGLDKWNQLKNK